MSYRRSLQLEAQTRAAWSLVVWAYGTDSAPALRAHLDAERRTDPEWDRRCRGMLRNAGLSRVLDGATS